MGDFHALNRELSAWIDWDHPTNQSPADALRQITSQTGLKLDVDWTLIGNKPLDELDERSFHGSVEELLSRQWFWQQFWRVEDGTLIKRNPMPPFKNTVVRVYDVFPLASKFGKGDPWRDWILYDSFSHERPLPAGELQARDNENVAEDIRHLIEYHIDPDIWKGRTNQRIQPCLGGICVTATPDVQARVERFIQVLNGEE